MLHKVRYTWTQYVLFFLHIKTYLVCWLVDHKSFSPGTCRWPIDKYNKVLFGHNDTLDKQLERHDTDSRMRQKLLHDLHLKNIKKKISIKISIKIPKSQWYKRVQESKSKALIKPLFLAILTWICYLWSIDTIFCWLWIDMKWL